MIEDEEIHNTASWYVNEMCIRDSIHNGLDLLFDFINFTIQFTDEPDGVLQFKGLGRHLRANRVFGGISYFKSHIPFVVTIGGGFEQCFQPCQMGCSNLFSAGELFQQSVDLSLIHI